ncbi:MAG: hypothetical protein AVDCRST_MAG93-7722, partial [uncultured Chloroflexia bacterium]
ASVPGGGGGRLLRGTPRVQGGARMGRCSVCPGAGTYLHLKAPSRKAELCGGGGV